ncbi:hypothetical protein BLOT_008276 [Blomia tropicalis]|nr:hypothetical protein BLOT_008276 [Blomia tropicalis]
MEIIGTNYKSDSYPTFVQFIVSILGPKGPGPHCQSVRHFGDMVDCLSTIKIEVALNSSIRLAL